MKKWQCLICGFSYAEVQGYPDKGIPAGTRWQDVPADWTCPDCGVAKPDFEMLTLAETSAEETEAAGPRPIIIIGSGLAGVTVAREFRKLDKDTPLTLITRDDGRYYSKPMLSNALAQGKDAVTLATATAAQLAEQLQARIITVTRIYAIDPRTRVVRGHLGSLPYAKLVLALGANPIRLPLDGDGAGDVLSVNDLMDYGVFRAAIAGKQRIAIMGAGLIGCEFANDLRNAGLRVDVIDPAPHPLTRLIPEPAGQALQAGLAGLGINWHLGTVVEHVARAGDGYRLLLADGTHLATDAVLSAIGLRPRTELARQAGLLIERGIVVDRFLQTSQEDIYALGDCAEVEGLVLPYIMPIMHAARALAKTLAGNLTPVSYPVMPVVVKTPAHPLIISPPALNASGEWHCEQAGQGIRALFRDHDGHLLGFALTGEAIAERQLLSKELPPVLA